MYEVLLFILKLFDMSVYRRYLNVYLNELRTPQGISALLILFCAAVNTVTELYLTGWINMLIYGFVLSILALQYSKKLMPRPFVVCTYMGIVVIAGSMTYAVCVAFARYMYVSEQVMQHFLFFAKGIVRIFLVELACKIKNNQHIEFAKMSRSIVTIFLMIPASSLFSCILLLRVIKDLFSDNLIILCLSIIYTIIITNYLVFLMMKEYTTVSEELYEEEMLLQEAKYRDEYYRNVESYMEEIQDIRHDMKNRLAGICYIAEHEGAEQVQKVVSEMLDIIENTEKIIYTANPTVNSILRVKAAKAEEQGICIDLNIFIPKKMSVSTGDLGVLYGNLLDNAIEACLKIPKDKRFIELDSKYLNGDLIIIMKNSKQPEESRELRTTKKDKWRHGRGIRLVRQTAERYLGTFFVEDKGEVFESRVILREIKSL